jgi:hypothetical protein
MSKLSDMIVSAILKRGILGEFRNFETEVEIPQDNKPTIKVMVKAENLQVRIDMEKEEK